MCCVKCCKYIHFPYSRIVINIECLCCDKPPAALAVDNFTFVFLTAIWDDAPLKFAAARVDVVTLNPPTGRAVSQGGRRCVFRKHCGRLPRGIRRIQSYAGGDQKFVLQTCMRWWWYHFIILYTIFVTRNPDLAVHVYESMYNRDVCHSNIFANVWTTLDPFPPPRNGISRYATLERSQTRDDVYIIRHIYNNNI